MSVRDVRLDLEFVPEVLRRPLTRPQSDPVKVGLRKHDQPRSSVAHVEILRTSWGLDADCAVRNPVCPALTRRLRHHTPEGEPQRWLFAEDDRPWHDNIVDYRWRSTRTDAGVRFKLHDLRHYFASGLIAAGCDVVTVQRAMGHASATTTLSTYAHLWPTAEDKTRAAASGMASGILECHAELTRSRQ